jgi:hypothetical protein
MVALALPRSTPRAAFFQRRLLASRLPRPTPTAPAGPTPTPGPRLTFTAAPSPRQPDHRLLRRHLRRRPRPHRLPRRQRLPPRRGLRWRHLLPRGLHRHRLPRRPGLRRRQRRLRPRRMRLRRRLRQRPGLPRRPVRPRRLPVHRLPRRLRLRRRLRTVRGPSPPTACPPAAPPATFCGRQHRRLRVQLPACRTDADCAAGQVLRERPCQAAQRLPDHRLPRRLRLRRRHRRLRVQLPDVPHRRRMRRGPGLRERPVPGRPSGCQTTGCPAATSAITRPALVYDSTPLPQRRDCDRGVVCEYGSALPQRLPATGCPAGYSCDYATGACVGGSSSAHCFPQPKLGSGSFSGAPARCRCAPAAGLDQLNGGPDAGLYDGETRATPRPPSSSSAT